jgi:hypothetical protein
MCSWRIVASVGLVCSMTVAASMQARTPAFAAACSPTNVITTTGSCDVAVGATVVSGGLTMTSDPSAEIIGGSIITLGLNPKQVNFTFTSQVVDLRGTAAGWKLLASSPTLGIDYVPNNATHYALSIDGLAPTSTCVGACPPVTETDVSPLTTTPQKFASVGDGTVIVQGNYSEVAEGHFTLPTNAPSGAYAGTITVGLSDSF